MKKSKTIIIVSGLPRSGTSMMMQILDAGGLTPLTDKKRKADSDNPKGYFEYEKAKALDKDDSWLPKARGKVFKLVVQLIPYLPDEFDYKIILMRRHMDEILKSQQIMLKEEDKNVDDIVRKIFKRDIRKAQEYSLKKGNVDLLEVWYPEVIKDTKAQIEKIINFLNTDLDTEQMANVVDPKLYRNKAQTDEN